MFALIDCNSFFCSCERVFRPDLRNTPVIVLSNNDGCVVSRTPEAKAVGIPMCAPYFKIRDLCEKNGVKVFSSNFSLYTDLSDRVMKTISKIVPQMDVYSVDEAFVELSSSSDYYLEGINIKEEVEKKTGIPVSIGIGKTKVLSKVANHIAKINGDLKGVAILNEEKYIQKALTLIPVDEIWGVGMKSALKLNSIGIKNALEFRNYSNEKTIQKILNKTGLQIQNELKGISCFPLISPSSKKKEIMTSRTFGSPVYTKSELKEAVANYTSWATEKLRRQNSLCRELSVFMRTSPHKDVPQYYSYETWILERATSDTIELIKVAHDLVDKMYRGGIEYKKVGVKLSNFYDPKETQLSLFDRVDSSSKDTLMKVMDKINIKHGNNTIKSLACGCEANAFKMRQTLKSKRFTTDWKELPLVF